MNNLNAPKPKETTDEELKEILNIYKGLNTTNRFLAVSVSGLLLTSQESNKNVGNNAVVETRGEG